MESDELKEIHSQIANKTFYAVFWNFLTYALSKGFVLLTTSILAHLLSKSDFGILAVALMAVNCLSIFKDFGFGAALIQRKEDFQLAANTVFTLNVIISLFLAILVFIISPSIGNYFNDHKIISVLRWLGLSFLFDAFGSVHIVFLKKELDFRRKLAPDIGNTIVKGIVSICMATSGFGVWSLVFGQLSGSLASTIIVWIVLPWRPRIIFNFFITKGLFKFGASIMGSDAIGIVTDNLAPIIIGRIFGTTLLGVYSIAYKLPEMLVISILWVIGGVLFPAFSIVQDELEKLRKCFLTTLHITQIVITPICLGFIIAADPIILVLFGEKWSAAIPILRLLAIYAWIYSMGFHAGAIYKAIGRPDLLLKLSIFTLIVVTPSLIIGARYGLIGVAGGHLLAMFIRRIISLKVAINFLDIPALMLLRELKPSFHGGLGFTALALTAMFLSNNLEPFTRLIVIIIFGAIGYFGLLLPLEIKNFRYLYNLLYSPK